MDETLTILLVEDYDDDRRVFSDILTSRGCRVDTAQSYNEAISKLTPPAKYDVVIIDLRIPGKSGEESIDAGVELHREIRDRKLDVGVIVLTGQPSMQSLKETEHLGRSSYLVKDKYLGIMELEQGAREFYNEVVKAARKRLSVEEVRQVEGQIKLDPFALSYDMYLKFDSRWVSETQRRAHALKDRWAADELKMRKHKWLILCGKEVVKSSPDMQELPRPEELDEIGKKTGLVPFVFFNLSVGEEVAAPQVDWRKVGPVDYYPTVSLHIRNNGKHVVVPADFDTGSPCIHLSLKDFLDKDVISENDVDTCRAAGYCVEGRVHLGVATDCYLIPVEIGATPDCRVYLCEFIDDWTESGFCSLYPERQALVGRPFLLHLPVRLELDGASKVTRVLPPTKPPKQ